MSWPVIAIADAVADAINEASLSMRAFATRQYIPKFDTKDAELVQVKVVPVSDTREMSTASSDNAIVVIDIGVMKRLQEQTESENEEVDALMDFVEELRAVVNRQRLADAVESVCIETSQNPIYSVSDLDEGRLFLTRLTATFMVPVTV
jgi:hypothetical protein